MRGAALRAGPAPRAGGLAERGRSDAAGRSARGAALRGERVRRYGRAAWPSADARTRPGVRRAVQGCATSAFGLTAGRRPGRARTLGCSGPFGARRGTAQRARFRPHRGRRPGRARTLGCSGPFGARRGTARRARSATTGRRPGRARTLGRGRAFGTRRGAARRARFGPTAGGRLAGARTLGRGRAFGTRRGAARRARFGPTAGGRLARARPLGRGRAFGARRGAAHGGLRPARLVGRHRGASAHATALPPPRRASARAAGSVSWASPASWTGAAEWTCPTSGAFGVRAICASCYGWPFPAEAYTIPSPRAARMAVALAGCSRAGSRLQPHASGPRPVSNAPGRRRCRASARAAWPEGARRVSPGRGSTANRVARTSPASLPARQLGQVVRADQQHEGARGNRRRSRASVSRCSGCRAGPRYPSPPCAALGDVAGVARRSAKGAMPRRGFSGLPGETSSQTSSRPSAAERLGPPHAGGRHAPD